MAVLYARRDGVDEVRVCLRCPAPGGGVGSGVRADLTLAGRGAAGQGGEVERAGETTGCSYGAAKRVRRRRAQHRTPLTPSAPCGMTPPLTQHANKDGHEVGMGMPHDCGLNGTVFAYEAPPTAKTESKPWVQAAQCTLSGVGARCVASQVGPVHLCHTTR